MLSLKTLLRASFNITYLLVGDIKRNDTKADSMNLQEIDL